MGLVGENGLIKGYSTLTYMESRGGFPFRYFTVSNNLDLGYHYCYMAVFDIEIQKRIEPIYACSVSNSEELVVYDLKDVGNFCFGRYTTVSNLFFQYKDYFFNYFVFSNSIKHNAYKKYDQFNIRYN